MNELSFPDFKRKHGLGYKEIQRMTGCSLEQARAYTKGAPIPEDLAKLIHAVDIVVSVAKANANVFSNIDAQQAIHEIELRDRLIEKRDKHIAHLESLIADLRNGRALSIQGLQHDAVFIDEAKHIEHKATEEWGDG